MTEIVVADGSNRLPVLAAEIIDAHAEARRAAQMTIEHAIRAGVALLEAKALVRHGAWLPWLRDNCEMSERSARVYMQLARNKDEVLAKSAADADLTIRGAVDALTEDPRLTETKAIAERIREANRALLDALEEKMKELREFGEFFFQLSQEDQNTVLAARHRIGGHLITRGDIMRWSKINQAHISNARWLLSLEL